MPKPWELDWTGVKTEQAPTTPQDMASLTASSAQAQAERDASQSYRQARQAVHDMGTGPYNARWLDAITPDEDGGFWDAVGGALGTIPRAVMHAKTFTARDHLRTISAQVALAGSQQMKGSSSDKDTALMRLSGISPYKSEAENNRIIDKATLDSGLAQTRAKLKADWIARFGSLARAAPNGTTFERALSGTEDSYRSRMGAGVAGRPALPPAPPSVRSKAAAGWRIEKAD